MFAPTEIQCWPDFIPVRPTMPTDRPLVDRRIGSGWGATAAQKARMKELEKLGWRPSRGEVAENSLETDAEDELAILRSPWTS